MREGGGGDRDGRLLRESHSFLLTIDLEDPLANKALESTAFTVTGITGRRHAWSRRDKLDEKKCNGERSGRKARTSGRRWRYSTVSKTVKIVSVTMVTGWARSKPASHNNTVLT